MAIVLQLESSRDNRKVVIEADNPIVVTKTNHPNIAYTNGSYTDTIAQSAVWEQSNQYGGADVMYLLVFEQPTTYRYSYYIGSSRVETYTRTTNVHNSDNTLYAYAQFNNVAGKLCVFSDTFNEPIGNYIPQSIPIAYNSVADYKNYYQNGIVNYQWTSVSAISGKMGSISLTEILNINNGNAVDNVALSGNINLSASSALNAMIDAVVQEDSNVTVSYSIPDETYSYIKLVYKKDRMPTSPSDGTAIDIAQSSTSQVISGIADGSTYWFTIFTDISESDPVSFDTVRTGWMGEEVILLYSGNSNTMTAQISDGHILFKLYSGETVIYSFNAYAGSTVSDANKIYVQFLKDDTNEIAKPSLVYFDGTNYSINQETPTDEQMANIYSWLNPLE